MSACNAACLCCDNDAPIVCCLLFGRKGDGCAARLPLLWLFLTTEGGGGFFILFPSFSVHMLIFLLLPPNYHLLPFPFHFPPSLIHYPLPPYLCTRPFSEPLLLCPFTPITTSPLSSINHLLPPVPLYPTFTHLYLRFIPPSSPLPSPFFHRQNLNLNLNPETNGGN